MRACLVAKYEIKWNEKQCSLTRRFAQSLHFIMRSINCLFSFCLISWGRKSYFWLKLSLYSPPGGVRPGNVWRRNIADRSDIVIHVNPWTIQLLEVCETNRWVTHEVAHKAAGWRLAFVCLFVAWTWRTAWLSSSTLVQLHQRSPCTPT